MNNPLNEWLQTKYVGRNTLVLDSVESTNDYAKNLLVENPPDGTVVLSRIQTKGRGQKTNSWLSPEGGLYYSCILNALTDDKLTMITLTCGIACHDAIKELCSLPVRLKWVNDIQINDKKIGGILTESRLRSNSASLIIGVGINVNNDAQTLPEDLRDISTSIYNETATCFNIYQLAALVSNNIEKYIELYHSNNHKLIKSLWINNSINLGKKIQFLINEIKKEGIIIDISEHGALIIQSYDGKEYQLSSNQDIVYLD